MKFVNPFASLKLSYRQNIRAWFYLFLALFSFLFFLFYESEQKFITSSKSVNQTNEVLTKSRNLLYTVIDIRADSREYLVTGNTKYLIEFYKEENQLQTELTDLKKISSGSTMQIAQSDSLFIIYKKLISLINQEVKLIIPNFTLSNKETQILDNGKIEFDKLIEKIFQIQTSQNNQLSDFQRETSDTAKTIQWIIIAFSLFAFFVMINAKSLLLKNYVDRENSKKELRKTKQFYEFSTRVNDLVLYEKNCDKIYAEICKIAIESGQFLLAWLGKPNDQSRSIIPIFWAGKNDGYIDILKNSLSMDDTPQGNGPSGNAFRNGHFYYCNDIANDPQMLPWRNEALKRGYHGSISLPIFTDKRVVGVLTLYTPEPNYFSGEVQTLLVRVSENIGFAIQNIQNAKKAKEIENQLRKVNTAIEQSTSSIVVTDTEGIIEYVNPAFCKLTGYSFEEAIGQNPKILKSGHTTDSEYKGLWNKINNNKPWNGEFYNKKKNGEFYWEYVTISPIVNDEGIITHFVAIKENITEKKNIELALEEQNKFNIRLLELSNDIISVIDKSGRFLLLSKSFEKILGYSRDELIGTCAIDTFIEADKNEAIQLFMRLQSDSDGGTARIQTHHLTKEGGVKFISWSTSWDSHTESFYAIGRDITKEKEDEVLKEQERVSVENKIRKAVFEGEEIQKRQMSLELHDNINQIQAAIKIYLDMYAANRKESALETAKSLLDKSIQEVRNLSHVIATPPIFDKGWVACIETLLHQIKMYSTINFIFNHDREEYYIPNELKINIYRILQEQITNIIKHAKADTTTINLTQTGYLLKFEISDNGVGFDSQKITDGIGLTNIKTRVSTFNGSIYIKTSQNNGCRMEIEFALPNAH